MNKKGQHWQVRRGGVKAGGLQLFIRGQNGLHWEEDVWVKTKEGREEDTKLSGEQAAEVEGMARPQTGLCLEYEAQWRGQSTVEFWGLVSSWHFIRITLAAMMRTEWKGTKAEATRLVRRPLKYWRERNHVNLDGSGNSADWFLHVWWGESQNYLADLCELEGTE